MNVIIVLPVVQKKNMITAPTDLQATFFLNVLLATFSWIKPPYRKLEKKTIKIQKSKETINFLKKCKEEKIIPPSMSWIKKLNNISPFPDEINTLINEEINNIKEEINKNYYNIRREKNNIFSRMPNGKLKTDLTAFLKNIGQMHAKKKRNHLDEKLARLMDKSPWSTFAQVESVVNLSSYNLSTNQNRILGYGLSFSLPHEKSHFLDFLGELDRFKYFDDKFNYNF